MPTLPQPVLDRILAQLPGEDALMISAALEPAWRVRERRLNQRDDLIRRELQGLAGSALTLGAAELGRRLKRAMWCTDHGDEVAAQILTLNGGRSIGWYQLGRIATKSRTPSLA